MGLLDSGVEEPKSKLRRYVITGVAVVVLVVIGLWYLFRFYPERRVVEQFFDALVAGDTQLAHRIWKTTPSSSYTYQDFLDDWGTKGYYGPIRSYHIETAENPPRGGSGVIVTVAVSPDQPFPDENDAVKLRRIKEVKIWVERRDHSLSFPP